MSCALLETQVDPSQFHSALLTTNWTGLATGCCRVTTVRPSARAWEASERLAARHATARTSFMREALRQGLRMGRLGSCVTESSVRSRSRGISPAYPHADA